MDVGCLGVDLARVIGLIKKLVLIHIAISIEGAQQEPLAHPLRRQITSSHLEDVGRLRLQWSTSPVPN